MKKKLGLALGGGGAKSFAHLGVIDVLREAGIVIDVLATCSSGSVIGALAANNVPTERIKKEFYSMTNRAGWFLPKFSRRGLLSQRGIRKILEELCGDISIQESGIPLHIITTNLNSGELCILDEGNLADAVCASTAFPGMYPPVEINHQLLVDGGILNSIPADICRREVGDEGVVIAITLDGYLGEKIDRRNMFSITYRSIYISLFHNRKSIIKANSDIVLDIFNESEFNFKNWKELLSFYSLKKMESFYELGRVKAIENLDEIKRVLET